MNDDAKNLILENLNLDQLNQAQKINNFKLLEKIFTSEKSIEDLLKVKDSIILYNEQPTQIFLNNEFNALESLMLVSEKQNDLNISKSINNRNTLVSIFLVAILFLIAVSLRFNYDLQKEKNTRLRLEKDKINEELKLKRRQLFSKINFISQRNDYLNSIRNQLDGDITSTKNLKSIKREIKNITTSEQAYEEFDKMFSQVYPNFYKRLNLAAKLSQTDIRLASYIKMNHSNNEISRISGISLRTVESQRYRLSKKLNLVKGQDLNRFILNI
jgi:DNA-binding CsgD family transcriptional regulator